MEQRDPENRPDNLERKIIVFRKRSSQPSLGQNGDESSQEAFDKASRKFLQFYDETYPLSFVLFSIRYRGGAWTIRKQLEWNECFQTRRRYRSKYRIKSR